MFSVIRGTKMPASLKLPPILPGQSLIGQENDTKIQNGSLKSMYTTTTKLHYQQPTQYPGSVLRAVEAYFKRKIYNAFHGLKHLHMCCNFDAFSDF